MSDKPSSQNSSKNPSPKKAEKIILILIGGALLIMVIAFVLSLSVRYGFKFKLPNVSKITNKDDLTFSIKSFKTEKEFKTYLEETDSNLNNQPINSFLSANFGGLMRSTARLEDTAEFPATTTPERVSGTNTQVLGIDEPDIMKTNGEFIFFSQDQQRVLTGPLDQSLTIPQESRRPGLKVIKAYPPAELTEVFNIEETGEMFLIKEKLVLIPSSESSIIGYDVASPENPDLLWKLDFDSTSSIVSARVYSDKIYLITRMPINRYRPCPVPLGARETSLLIDCAEIYHPENLIPIDSTYSVLIVNPEDGRVENRATFVGSQEDLVLYMSEKSIYAAFSFHKDLSDFYLSFFNHYGKELLGTDVVDRMEEINSYKISEFSKLNEIQSSISSYLNLQTEEERKRIQEDMDEKLNNYVLKNMRSLVRTGIFKLDSVNLGVKGQSEFPGVLVNQFSLDEFEGNLRVATTTSSIFDRTKSVNDVYILDEGLKEIGKILDLGLSERIYSARFVREKGYLVTFRITDPFYVIDLKNPKSPQIVGQLKIPGFSSYLHPLGENLILGVGKEGTNVKLSLFDVSDPSNPQEVSKYDLPEYWTSVSETHHAFLSDPKHNIFFIPAGDKAYVFTYENQSLGAVEIVSGISARRALFIDDYFYILANEKVSAFDENSWNVVKEIEL